jgi:hypothetical protein
MVALQLGLVGHRFGKLIVLTFILLIALLFILVSFYIYAGLCRF